MEEDRSGKKMGSERKKLGSIRKNPLVYCSYGKANESMNRDSFGEGR